MSYYPGQGHHGHQQQQPPQYPPYDQQYPPPQQPQQPYYPPPQQGGYYPPPQHQPPPNQPYYPPPQGYPSPQPPPQHGGHYQQQPPPSYPPPQGYPPTGNFPNSPPPNHYGHTDGSRIAMPTVNQNAYNSGNHNAPPPPPTGPQSFGIPNYQWVPSKCTGKRKALLIGINYFGQQGQLRGCINDVKNMSTFLHERFGYAREDMVILTDDQQNPRSQPTKQNIIQAMHWLIKDAQPDDSLFFHYSGHGGQTKDMDGDENDGYDETIYPVDFRVAGHIVDDEMHRILVQTLKPGVRLTAIFDSCHSGSALDLPYLYSTQGVLKEPNLAKEAGSGLLSAIAAYGKGDIGGVASSALGFLKKATTGQKAEEKARRTKTSPADVIQWSGSKDIQTSADAFEAGEATGAMSWAFITSLKKNPQQSYQQLLTSIRSELQGKYQQKPQLSCSHPLGTDENSFYF